MSPEFLLHPQLTMLDKTRCKAILHFTENSAKLDSTSCDYIRYERQTGTCPRSTERPKQPSPARSQEASQQGRAGHSNFTSSSARSAGSMTISIPAIRPRLIVNRKADRTSPPMAHTAPGSPSIEAGTAA